MFHQTFARQEPRLVTVPDDTRRHERIWSLVSWVVGTDKRERQKANRLARIEADRKAEQKGEMSRKVASFVVIGILLFGGLYLYSVVSSNDDEQVETTTGEDAAGEVTPATTVVEPVTTLAPPETMLAMDPVVCPEEDGSSARATNFATPMPLCIDETATYIAQITTDKGDVTIELDANVAPNTVNNFVSLARYHFYDGVAFHRIIPGFMIQGGDAVGAQPGIGGPGYSFEDELPEEGDYQVGSVAMANSGPDTQGSQFFIVTGDAGVNLNPAYSLFGQVTEGMDVVTAIEATGSGDAAGTPSESSIIESIIITEK